MEALTELRAHYQGRFKGRPEAVEEGLRNLTQRYVERWELTAQAIASGIAVTSLVQSGGLDVATIDPQVREAFQLAYPNVPLDSLSHAGPDEVAGYLNGWKGKLFEVQVRDQLNAGDTIGGIHLAPGQEAALAQSATQPGWDVQILNDDGSVADVVQLKATESLAYVHDALERYPDISVLATSDLTDHAASIKALSTSVISEDDLQRAIEAPFDEVADDDIWDSLLPGLPFLLIGARQGLAVFSNEKSWTEALKSATADSARSAAAIGGAYIAHELATEFAGEIVEDLAGDLIADFLLGAVLPFGVGFLIRKLLRGGEKPRARPISQDQVIGGLDKALIGDWVMPRALLVQRALAKRYLPPPHPKAS